MNLLQIATLIGQRLGVDTSDPNSRDGAAVRGFVGLWHDIIYRSFLWKDSIIEYVLPIDPSVAYVPTSPYMPTKGHLILPSIFQNVLAARTSENKLDVQRPMIYYRVQPDSFTKSGTPLEFFLLSSCVWEFDTAQNLFLQAANNADNGTNVTLDELQPDGVTLTRSIVAATNAGAAAGNTDRVDNLIKPETQGKVTLNITGLVAVNTAGDVYSYYAPGVYFQVILASVIGTDYTITPGANEAGGTLVNGAQNIQLAVGVPITVTAQTAELTFTNPNGAVANQPLTAVITAPGIGAAIVTLQPADLSAPKCQRIRIMWTPAKATTVRVLGKRNTPPLSAETDIPGINGLDAILVAIGYYMFKSRDEGGGTPDATAALTEAVGPQFLAPAQGQPCGKPGGLLAQLIGVEVLQEANNSRILPDSGFGDPTYYGADETNTKFWS
jgi:hypothetical protein